MGSVSTLEVLVEVGIVKRVSNRLRMVSAALSLLSVLSAVHATTDPSALNFAFFSAIFAIFLLAPSVMSVPDRRIPLSRLRAGFRVGKDYFARRQIEISNAPQPTGLFHRVESIAPIDAAEDSIHPALRAFLERTSEHRLFVIPHWHRPFRWIAPLVLWMARRLGQFEIPFREEWIDTRVFGIKTPVDSRGELRGVVRTYHSDERPMQVAAYGAHRLQEIGYMNCAFPLPGGNLTGILRYEAREQIEDVVVGIALTSIALDRNISDAGIWYVTPFFTLRLPLREVLRFWATGPSGRPPFANDPVTDATVVGDHQMFLFGLHLVTNRYFLRHTPNPPPQ